MCNECARIHHNGLTQTQGVPCSRNMSALPDYTFETLKVTSPKEFVFQVELNRPDKLNAINHQFWKDLPECFDKIAQDPDCRVIVFSASGRIFTAGLDFKDSKGFLAPLVRTSADPGRRGFAIRTVVRKALDCMTAIEKCPKPVIAAVHSACVGGGIDLITAADIRYCSKDAWFSIKEMDSGFAADVGTLKRLPKIVGNESLVRELAFTGRKFFSDEAKEMGLVSRVFPDKESLVQGAIDLAEQIASKSPIAVQGTKVNLVYARDHSVQESLDYIVTWNQSMLQSEDVMKAAMAGMKKEKATFAKL